MVVILQCILISYIAVGVHRVFALNLGLIAGDTKRHTSPLLIKKDYRHSPVFINFAKPVKLPELPKQSDLSSLLKKRSPLLPIKAPVCLPPLLPIIPPVLVPPLIPKLPLIPPIIHAPIIPRIPSLTGLGGPLSPVKLSRLGGPLSPVKLSRLGGPLSPVKLSRLGGPLSPVKLSRLGSHLSPIKIPKLSDPFSPIKVPILKKSMVGKKLGKDLKSLTLPPVNLSKKDSVLDKLKELRKKGSLTTAEFIRFKKLLL